MEVAVKAEKRGIMLVVVVVAALVLVVLVVQKAHQRTATFPALIMLAVAAQKERLGQPTEMQSGAVAQVVEVPMTPMLLAEVPLGVEVEAGAAAK